MSHSSHSLQPSHYGSTHKYSQDTTTISLEQRLFKITFSKECKNYSSDDFIINMLFLNLIQISVGGGQCLTKNSSDDQCCKLTRIGDHHH